jgi:hypothetical protein
MLGILANRTYRHLFVGLVEFLCGPTDVTLHHEPVWETVVC